jgi:MFS transporter, FHS family, Na+ dependent glucose transporter 1
MFLYNTISKSPLLKTALAYFASFISLGLAMMVIGPTLPALAKQTGSTLAGISIILAARSLGYLLGALIGGWLYDRRPGHPVMGTVLIITAAIMLMVPFLTKLWMLTLVILIMGSAQSILDVGCNTLIIWLYGSKVGPFMNGLHFAFGLGALVAPLIVAQSLLNTGLVNWAYWIMAGLVLLPAIILLRLPSPRIEKDIDVQNGQPVRKSNALVWLFALLFMFYVGCEATYADWIYTYGIQSGLADETTAAYLTSAFFALFTLSRLMAIPLAARFRPASILTVDLLGVIISMTVLSIWGDQVVVLWAGTLIFGISIASVFATSFTLAEEQMHIGGRTTSIIFVGASTGGLLFPWLAGQLIDFIGPLSLMWLVLGCGLMMFGTFQLILRLGNHKTT